MPVLIGVRSVRQKTMVVRYRAMVVPGVGGVSVLVSQVSALTSALDAPDRVSRPGLRRGESSHLAVILNCWWWWWWSW